MSSIYANTGCDIDSIFYTGDGAETTNIYDDTGQDIGLKYSAGSADWDTGIVASSGQDIGRFLGGEVATVYMYGPCVVMDSRGYPTTDTAAPVPVAWEKASNFANQKSQWTKCSWGGTYTVPRWSKWRNGFHTSYDSDAYYYSQCAVAYAFHIDLHATKGDASVGVGAIVRTKNDDLAKHPGGWSGYSGSVDDYRLSASEIRKPTASEINFVVSGLNGYKSRGTWKWYNDGYAAEWEFTTSYWVFDTAPVVITLSVGGIATRSVQINLKI